MKLNLPILEQISECESILIAGMGGGYDIFAGLPLYFELEQLGYDVHLANLSFSDISGLYEGEQLTDTLVGVSTDVDGIFDYFPEYFLSEWFYSERNDDVLIWCIEKAGARPLIKDYKTLIKHLEIDCIILVDGGVDSLMRGDEAQPGTMFEDTLSLVAVNELNEVPVRLMACLGLGIEHEVGYAHLFENIARLVKKGAFKGSCSLTKAMASYQSYMEAAMYVFDQQPDYPSVIHSSVISAINGEYGNYHLLKRTEGNLLRISALMPIYWFFDASVVAKQNILLPHLKFTYTVDEAWKKMQEKRESIVFRKTPEYPLP